ncbi:hypothetical protein KNE206_66250 [Kitasatospora sp. NE20-6]|uniref:SpoIIE family protein phosphatase n=1 Tax=Kitasatospora sp. NE20-6 TaxID=2859066 RepID=UPI0034DC4866
MDAVEGHRRTDSPASHTPTGLATAVTAADGTVLRWSTGAAALLGRTAGEVCGRPLTDLLAPAPGGTGIGPAPGDRTAPVPVRAALAPGTPTADGGEVRQALLRHRSGAEIPVTLRAVAFDGSDERLVLMVPDGPAGESDDGTALLRALLTQDRIGVSIHRPDLSVARANTGHGTAAAPALPVGGHLDDLLAEDDAAATEAALRHVLETGRPLVGLEHRLRAARPGAAERSASLSAVRLEDALGRPTGLAVLRTDATEQARARDRLELRHLAFSRVGGSLRVHRTAQDLAEVLVPAFGDLAWVDLAEAVLVGDEPPRHLGGGDLHLRRQAVSPSDGRWPDGMIRPGGVIPPFPDVPFVRAIQGGRAVALDRAAVERGLVAPAHIRAAVPEGGHALAVAPLFARGLVLGMVAVWRTTRPEPFDRADTDLLTEIAAHAALSVDNARRYTREHRAAAALQQRLLPRAGVRTSTVETAGSYLPAAGGAEIGGDWFDVIELPSLRVALVVGDVIGHGLHATATMGRLRTAVQTLADLELAPDELLAHLDDLVARLGAEARPEDSDGVGATCLFALHDPVSGQCAMASAGHPPPLLADADGTVRAVPLSPGPPLGVGGLPFETATVRLAPGSVLALYTDGLLDRPDHDLDAAVRRLRDRLAASLPRGSLQSVGRGMLAEAVLPARDDIALLLARVRALPPEATAQWEFPAEPSAVAPARAAAARRLEDWGMAESAFGVELIVSELVTNAVRYAGGPVGLRLIRDRVLVCEVTDPSNTQPRLRRARSTDEGGRGLFLVAQLSSRWGSRYGPSGKTIWAELPLPA